MPSPTAAVELFRRAVSAGAFLEAEQLLEIYRREVEASWKAATCDQQRLSIAMEVGGVFEWARTATLAARSHAQHKLILLRRESAYTPSISTNDLLHLDA
jgi:hypothetical protein